MHSIFAPAAAPASLDPPFDLPFRPPYHQDWELRADPAPPIPSLAPSGHSPAE
ncbi:MAG: hypothetical protein WBE38_19605 [Terracidiphilus sp.]